MGYSQAVSRKKPLLVGGVSAGAGLKSYNRMGANHSSAATLFPVCMCVTSSSSGSALDVIRVRAAAGCCFGLRAAV